MLSQLMSRVSVVVRALVRKAKNEPIVLLHVLAGAFAAGAAAAADVENKTIAAVVAAGAVLTVLERQLVRPEGKAKAQDDYTQWLEDKSFSESEFLSEDDLRSELLTHAEVLDTFLDGLEYLDEDEDEEPVDLEHFFGELDEEE